MDPNATLRSIEDALSESPKDYYEASRLRGILSVWLNNGGFAPNWHACPKASRYCAALAAF